MARSPVLVALRYPGAAASLGLAIVVRAPQSVLGLLMLLRTRELAGSYALAGAAAAATALGFAVGSPMLGRLVDRRGLGSTLTVSALVCASALVAAAALPDGSSAAVLIALATIAGASQPPVAAALRTAIFHHVDDPRSRHAAMGLQASSQELSLVLGPLIFVSALGATAPARGLLAAAAVLVVTTLLFVRLGFAAVPRVARDTSARRALAPRVVRVLLGIGLIAGFGFGSMEVATAAAAEGAVLGVMLAIYCIGSVAAGVAVSARDHPSSPARSLLVILLAGAAGQVVLTLVWQSSAWLAVGLFVTGATAAPLLTIVYSAAGAHASAGTLTETFTWMGSSIFAGAALGSACGGVLASETGVAAAYAAAAVSCFVGAVAVHRVRATLDRVSSA